MLLWSPTRVMTSLTSSLPSGRNDFRPKRSWPPAALTPMLPALVKPKSFILRLVSARTTYVGRLRESVSVAVADPRDPSSSTSAVPTAHRERDRQRPDRPRRE